MGKCLELVNRIAKNTLQLTRCCMEEFAVGDKLCDDDDNNDDGGDVSAVDVMCS